MRSRGPSIDRFFQRYLRHPYGVTVGKPFVMEGWQRAFTNYAHQLDAHGNRVFRRIVLGIPRGNGKSPLAAGYGMYELMAMKDVPHVYCLGASRSLSSIVHNFARGFVEGGPLQHHGVRAGRASIDYGDAFFQAVAAGGLLTHGKNTSVLLGDELHAFTNAIQVESWNGMVTSLGKRGRHTYAMTISTAGFDLEGLLGIAYSSGLALPLAPIRHSNPCLRIHEDREKGILLWWYGIPEELHHRWEDRELWRKANPAGWLDMHEMEIALADPQLGELAFQRLILNMWTSSAEPWLPIGVWADCAALEDEEGYERDFPRSAPIWVGVDVGWHDDSTAVVWATRLKNGRIALRAKVWTTRKDQLGEYVDGGTMKLELVEKFILEELRPRYKIKEIAFDPNYFGRSAEILENSRAGLRGKMIEMPPWHGSTAYAWEEFKQLAIEDELSHDNDPVLNAHVAAAGTRTTNSGKRVTKLESGKIDALAAAVLATARCQLATKDTRSGAKVFWMDIDGEPGPGVE